MSEGWKCPVCGRGVAPSEKTCEHGEGHGGLEAPFNPNTIPMGPSRIEPRMPSLTGDRYVPPYEITCGGFRATSTFTIRDIGQNGAGPCPGPTA